jgi:hypothetical protein
MGNNEIIDWEIDGDATVVDLTIGSETELEIINSETII